MKIKAWQLPWKGHMVPHAVIDILRGCNISCRACYNTIPPTTPKSLDQIREELEALLKIRRLSSVSLLGGEVSLHPQLCDIIRMIKDKGLCVELMSNGLEVDAEACKKYKDAGLDVLYFHIERGQKRPDLKSADHLNELRREKARMAGAEGLDAGLTLTSYPGEVNDVKDIIELTLQTPEINYLLITLFRDNSNVETLTGDIISGFSGTGMPPDKSTLQNNDYFAQWMKEEMKFEPFAAMGSNLDKEDYRWLSYLIGTVYEEDGSSHAEFLKASLLEKFAMFVFRMKGRYPMYMKQNPEMFRKQLILNGLLGGKRKTNMNLFRKSSAPGTRLTAKRLLFQNPAQLTEDGRLIHCEWCPDAVLKNSSLIPVCISDNIS